jgi:eukaryotic-like serine/threonine-protein kinase
MAVHGLIPSYDTQVTGNVEKAQQTCELWAQTYPREMLPHGLLAGLIYQVTGKYEKAVAESEKAIELDKDFAIAYDILVYSRESLGQLEEAEKTLQQASQRKLKIPWFLLHRYHIAFLRADTAGMERVAAEGSGADEIANQESFALAYAGHLRQARKMSQRATELALQNSQRETAALWETGGALQEAFFGNSLAARRSATAALTLSRNREVEYGAAVALAISGDSSRAQTLANDLERRFPEDTSVRLNYVPTLHALFVLDRQAAQVLSEFLPLFGPHNFSDNGLAPHPRSRRATRPAGDGARGIRLARFAPTPGTAC